MLKELTDKQRKTIELTIDYYRPKIEASSQDGLYIIGQLISAFCQEFGTTPVKGMQEYFDAAKMVVKIVAIPVESEVNRHGELNALSGVTMPSDIRNYDIGLPFIPEAQKDMPYWAWITVARLGEYSDLLAQLGVSEEENLSRLDQTGMLLMKPNSDTSRAINAPYN